MKNTRPFAAAIIVVLFLLAGCGGDEPRQIDSAVLTTDPPETETNPTSPDSPGGTAVVPEVESGQPIAVVLHDGNIGFPATLVPGPAVLNVQNSGTMQHSLSVEQGGGAVVTLDVPLDQGQTGSKEVVFAEGTARVFCPVLDHANKGESVEVKIAR